MQEWKPGLFSPSLLLACCAPPNAETGESNSLYSRPEVESKRCITLMPLWHNEGLGCFPGYMAFQTINKILCCSYKQHQAAFFAYSKPPDSGPSNTSHSASSAIAGFSPPAAAVFMKGITGHGACDSRRQGWVTQEASPSPILCKDWCTRCCRAQTLLTSLARWWSHLPFTQWSQCFTLDKTTADVIQMTHRDHSSAGLWPYHAGHMVEKGWLFAPKQWHKLFHSHSLSACCRDHWQTAGAATF